MKIIANPRHRESTYLQKISYKNNNCYLLNLITFLSIQSNLAYSSSDSESSISSSIFISSYFNNSFFKK